MAAWSVTAGDIDLDGDNDIVIGHNFCTQTQWSGVSIMLNDGDGTFYLNDSIYLYSWQTHIHTVNTNSGSYPEIIARHFEDNTNYMAILEYVQGNYISNLHYMPYGISGHNIGDINGDEYVDIVVYSHDGQFWGYMLNDGTGNFASPWYIYVQDYYPSDIACADLNADGWDDIVVTGQKTEVYFSYPGSFNELVLEYGWYGDVSIADFDQDGDMDILTIGFTLLKMHENKGNNTFFSHDMFSFQSSASRFFISDFNNDSFPDLLFQLDNHTGYLIYYNLGDFQLDEPVFVPLPPSNPEEGWRNCYCADMDGNGYNDIITVKTLYIYMPDNLEILFNDGNGNFVNNPVTVPDKQIPESLNPIICYPNPFSNQLTIEIISNTTGLKNAIMIYDTKGILVKAFEGISLGSGNDKVIWNGKDLSGKEIPPGIYFLSLIVSGEKAKTIKLLKQ